MNKYDKCIHKDKNENYTLMRTMIGRCMCKVCKEEFKSFECAISDSMNTQLRESIKALEIARYIYL